MASMNLSLITRSWQQLFSVTARLSHVPPMLFGASRPVELDFGFKQSIPAYSCHPRNRPCWQAVQLPSRFEFASSPAAQRGVGADERGYLILARHSFRRSSSKRTWDSMASCSAAMPLLENSVEAFLSRFCLQSRIACLVAFWASVVALTYVFVQASAIEHVWHSWAAAGAEASKASVAARTLIAFLPVLAPEDVLL